MSLPESWRTDIAALERRSQISTSMAKDTWLRDAAKRWTERADRTAPGVLRVYSVDQPSAVLAYTSPPHELKEESGISYTRVKREGEHILCREDDIAYSITIPANGFTSPTDVFRTVGEHLRTAIAAVTSLDADDLAVDEEHFAIRYTGDAAWETPTGVPPGPTLSGNSVWARLDGEGEPYQAQVQGIIPVPPLHPDDIGAYIHLPTAEEPVLRRHPTVSDFSGEASDALAHRLASRLVEDITGGDDGSDVDYDHTAIKQLAATRFHPSSSWVNDPDVNLREGEGYCLLNARNGLVY